MKVQVIYKTILFYCLKCRKSTENKNTKVGKTKNKSTILLSKFPVFDSKKLTFIKELEAKGLLGILVGAKILILGDIPLVNTLF